MKNVRQKGFTLIELLVVIAIIGLLSTLAVVALNSARGKSRDAKRIADVKSVQTALELYYTDNNGYPAVSAVSGSCALGVLGCGNAAKLCNGGFQNSAFVCTSTYMGQVPLAPTAADGEQAGGPCASGASTTYTYSTPIAGAYNIAYCMGNNTGDVASGPHNATPNGVQ